MSPAPEYPEYSQAEILAQCHSMLCDLLDAVDQLSKRIDGLEEEFAPLARKYSKLVNAIPGRGGRGSSNGLANSGAPGAAPVWRRPPR